MSGYDLTCRSGYDLTCRSRQGDHVMGSPPATRGEAVFEAVAGAVDVDHVAVVQQSVEDGGGEHVVAEHAAPFGEALVGGDDHGAAFVSTGDELEDHVGFGPVQG